MSSKTKDQTKDVETTGSLPPLSNECLTSAAIGSGVTGLGTWAGIKYGAFKEVPTYAEQNLVKAALHKPSAVAGAAMIGAVFGYLLCPYMAPYLGEKKEGKKEG
eukprot:gb/GEZN01023888.1/.p1 GENE.gb/GEZN01023888.1/~~gb/GEZN01023888.1/.p1  ORF type:complete len:104 (+),score=14.89 gb/GEZN01023888.1/:24-335(+)